MLHPSSLLQKLTIYSMPHPRNTECLWWSFPVWSLIFQHPEVLNHHKLPEIRARISNPILCNMWGVIARPCINFNSGFATQPFKCQDRVNSVYLGQYHGRWCPGSLRRQGINIHDIDLCRIGRSSSYSRRNFSYLCLILLVWRNDIKCKDIFLFSLKNLARKGLRHGWLNISYSLNLI